MGSCGTKDGQQKEGGEGGGAPLEALDFGELMAQKLADYFEGSRAWAGEAAKPNRQAKRMPLRAARARAMVCAARRSYAYANPRQRSLPSRGAGVKRVESMRPAHMRFPFAFNTIFSTSVCLGAKCSEQLCKPGTANKLVTEVNVCL